MSLDIKPIRQPERVEGETLQERFDSFHAMNPWILDAIETLAARYIDQGRRRIGIGMLFEVLRWEHDISTRGESLKLNNSYRSRYVRTLLAKHPEWEPIFHTRSLTTA